MYKVILRHFFKQRFFLIFSRFLRLELLKFQKSALTALEKKTEAYLKNLRMRCKEQG